MPPRLVPLTGFCEYPVQEMRRRTTDFLAEMSRRRSVRHFSSRPVPRGVVEDCIRVAMTAPSGANRQPWRFVLIGDPEVKQRIRAAAEEEERSFYGGRAPAEWLEALAPLGTDARKPFLEAAPYLIAIFAELHGVDADGSKTKHYYVNESVGIATGMLITALHHAGLATLTHTPSPMRFLNEILDRPTNEKPYLILVVGYPELDATVPEISRKSFEASCQILDIESR
jgi:iodotyrosine deiodinase